MCVYLSELELLRGLQANSSWPVVGRDGAAARGGPVGAVRRPVGLSVECRVAVESGPLRPEHVLHRALVQFLGRLHVFVGGAAEVRVDDRLAEHVARVIAREIDDRCVTEARERAPAERVVHAVRHHRLALHRLREWTLNH